MSALLFIPIFLDLFSNPVSAIDAGNWLIIAGLALKVFVLKGAKKKEEDKKMAAKANKAEVKEELEKVDLKLKDKVGVAEFRAHEKDNDKQHKDIIHIRDRLDAYLDGLKK